MYQPTAYLYETGWNQKTWQQGVDNTKYIGRAKVYFFEVLSSWRLIHSELPCINYSGFAYDFWPKEFKVLIN